MGLFDCCPAGYTLARTPRQGARTLSSPAHLLAEIALDSNVREIAERLFTYEIPANLRLQVFVGSQVLVPFGQGDLKSGFVVSIKDSAQLLAGEGKTPAPANLRAISAVLDSQPLFPPTYIEFLYWVADYYLCSIAEVLAAAIPADISARVKRMVRLLEPDSQDLLSGLSCSPAQASPEAKIRSVLREAGRAYPVKSLKEKSGLPASAFYSALARLKSAGALEIVFEAKEATQARQVNQLDLTGCEPRTKRQQDIVSCLKRHSGSLSQAELIAEAGCTSQTIKRMVSEGILSLSQVDVLRDPLKRLHNKGGAAPQLTDAQSQVLAVLLAELKKQFDSPETAKENPEPAWLLHGVTGSGKTEVYLRLIEETLAQQRAALLLVPEISLTPQLAERLLSRFGEQVGIWHSALSAGERFDTFRRIRAGELKLVLGARSAILTQIPQLGLIILDEEHDGSYKQSMPAPRYSARRLAEERGRREGCLVLFGSATPDTGSYLAAQKAGRILRLPERVFARALPESIFVDMRHEFSRGNKSVISLTLQEELANCLSRGEQAILLINRRGYASHIFCRACGEVLSCNHCSVSLVFHSRLSVLKPTDAVAGGSLICHHCGFSRLAPDSCPACRGTFLRQAGLGTQKVQEETIALLPGARVLRLDSDITAHKGAYEDIFHQFSAGEADILIGTQIVAKGLDIARVTLVGVLAADAAFNLPDFRSLERGFQLLTQVSGRAGRGEAPGKVILQTYNTDLPALIQAKNQNYDSFIGSELESRRAFEYPPYCQLVRILASGEDEARVQACLERLAEQMSNQLEEFEQVKILGPAPCLIEKIKGHFRHHLIVKNMMGEEGRQAIAAFLRLRSFMPGVKVTVDVDPVDLV